MRHDWQNVEMPDGIAALPRDARGFPITFVTLIDSDGRPDFTTIDGQKILRCVLERRCGMCGAAFYDDETNIVAFVGGPLSCENQNFLDPPMHVECALYAMKVCPHIAINTSRYSKPKPGGPEGRELFTFVSDERPEKFGLYLVPVTGYRIEYIHGQPVFLAGAPLTLTWQENLT